MNLRMKSEGKIFYITYNELFVAVYGIKNAFRLLKIFIGRENA